MVLKIYAINSIAIQSVDDDDSILHNTEYRGNMSHQCDVMFHPCDMTSAVSIQSLNSSALLLPTPRWHRAFVTVPTASEKKGDFLRIHRNTEEIVIAMNQTSYLSKEILDIFIFIQTNFQRLTIPIDHLNRIT